MNAARAVPRPAAPAWPSSHQFVEAVQNPRLAFRSAELQRCQPALDRFGIPLVASGNFAYAFKLRDPVAQRAVAVRCFRGHIPDRDQRYREIDRHLRGHGQSAVASFVFDAEGILVGGRRYPVVVMEWIEGPTLDLYIEQILGNKPALEALADQWLRTVRGLGEAELAHGDLQHGNIIVRDGAFRLIDLDAMYVPAMHGWRSHELGHSHFQHPRRDLDCFDLGLDRFSALVIHLSIVALAEAPELWQRYHDENLIFTRQDFLAPASSPLFADIRRLGGLPRQLLEALEQALRGRPADTPDLLQIAAPRSGLPAWMIQAPEVRIEVKTREAAPGAVVAAAASPAPARAVPWPVSHPAGRPSAPVPPPTPAYVPPLHFQWARVHQDALTSFGAWFLTALAVGLLPMLGIATALHGVIGPWFVRHLLLLGALFIGSICLGGAYLMAMRAEYARVETLRRALAGYPALYRVAAPSRRRARQPMRLIGDRRTRLYHDAGCFQVPVLLQQRAVFASAHIAQAHGYSACPNCQAWAAVP